jgi:superfamily I DNA/RNA helicase
LINKYPRNMRAISIHSQKSNERNERVLERTTESHIMSYDKSRQGKCTSMSNCFPSFIVRWILNFVDHENHANWHYTNKSDFTLLHTTDYRVVVCSLYIC